MRGLPTRVLVAGGVLVALLLAGVVSVYASSAPDGLERVAGEQGISHTERSHPAAEGPLAGYRVQGVDHARLSAGAAGVTGTLVVLVLSLGVVAIVRRRSATDRD